MGRLNDCFCRGTTHVAARRVPAASLRCALQKGASCLDNGGKPVDGY